jgi:hypothetical protein
MLDERAALRRTADMSLGSGLNATRQPSWMRETSRAGVLLFSVIILILLFVPCATAQVDALGMDNEMGGASAARPPENLTARWEYPCAILAWGPPDGGPLPGSYMVKGSTIQGYSRNLAQVNGSLEYRDYDVRGGYTYYYAVAAVNDDGEGESTLEVSVTIPASAPPLASSDMAVEYAADSVYINWSVAESSEGHPVEAYHVYSYVWDAASPQLVCTIRQSGLGIGEAVGIVIMAADLNPSWPTYFYVRPFDPFGEGPAGPVVSVVPPSVPGIVASMEIGWGDGYVEFSWSPPMPSTGYVAYPLTSYTIMRGSWVADVPWYLAGPDQFRLVSVDYFDLPPTELSFNDTAVTNGGLYSYDVAASNELGRGEWKGLVARPGSPSAVNDLSVTESDGVVRVTWLPPSNDCGSPISGYVLVRTDYHSYPGDQICVGLGPGATSYLDIEVAQGWGYGYQVLAVNSFGESILADLVQVYVSIVERRPYTPTDVTVECVHDGVWVNLTAPVGGGQPENYAVLVKQEDWEVAVDWKQYSTGSRRESLFIDCRYIDLVGGMDCGFSVCARNAFGESPLTQEFVVRLRFIPGMVDGMDCISDGAEVTVCWAAPFDDGGAPLLGYHIVRFSVDAASGRFDHWANFTVPADALRCVDADAPLGRTVAYGVMAFNEMGEGWISVAQVIPGAPTAPLGLSAIEGDGHILVSWAPPLRDGGSPVRSYLLEWRDVTSGDGGSFPIAGSQLSFDHAGVENGHELEYTLKACNDLGGAGEEATLTAMARGVPSTPGNLRGYWAVNGTGGLEIVLAWDPLANDGGGCRVLIHKTGWMFVSTVIEINGTETSFVDCAVIGNRTFSYYLVAVNGGLESGRSHAISVTPMQPENAPQDLRAVPGSGFVNLTWLPPAALPDGFSGYSVLRAEGNGTLLLLAHVQPGTLCYNDSGTVGGRTYSYAVRADGVTGNSTPAVRVRAGGLGSAEVSSLGFNWASWLVLIIAGVSSLAVLVFAPWRRARKAVAGAAVLGTAIIIVMAAAMVPAPPPSSGASAPESVYEPGNYFVWGMYGQGGMGTVTAKVLRVGDTTVTWNFTYEMPGMPAESEQQTLPKNQTSALTMSLMNMTEGSDLGGMEVVRVLNKTMPTAWGYLAVQLRQMGTAMLGMDISIDIWSAGDSPLRVEYGISNGGEEQRMLLFELLDTNMPYLVGL